MYMFKTSSIILYQLDLSSIIIAAYSNIDFISGSNHSYMNKYLEYFRWEYTLIRRLRN